MKHKPFYWTPILLLLGATIAAAQQDPSPAATAATSADQAKSDEAPPSPAAQALEQAIDKLAGYDWIQAAMRQELELAGRQYSATGRHLQGPGLLLRRELQVDLGERGSSLLQVCDGESYLRRQDTQTQGQTIEDIGQVQVESVQTVLDEIGDEELADTTFRGMGLTKLHHHLQGLRDTFDFQDVESGELEGRPVTILSGRWKPEVVAQYQRPSRAAAGGIPGPVTQTPEAAADDEEQPEEVPELPDHIPDEIVIYLGQEDGVPYRIDFQKRTDEGRPNILLTRLELFDVILDEPISEEEFQYILPPGVEPERYTDDVITQLRMLANYRAAQRAQQPPAEETATPSEQDSEEEPGTPADSQDATEPDSSSEEAATPAKSEAPPEQ